MIEFGLSISTDEHIEKLPVKRTSRFDFLEFSGNLLDSDAACRKLESLRKAGCSLVVRDMLDPSLVHLVQTENFQVKLEFDRKLHERCKTAASLGVDMAGIAFDITRALEAQDYADGLMKLMKSTFATFHGNSMKLVIPGRIPSSPGAGNITQFFAFLKNVMYSNIVSAIEFHPHEPGAFEELEQHFGVLRFHRNFFRLFFEPEHGNYLSSALLKKFLDAADMKSVVSSRVAIAPGHQMPDDAMLKELLELISGIENEY
ncbi:MAG: hypothetical protein IJW08_02075 [Lentisphaeria bacterium]|nr:hypothetical protein [Lentisphaeria bacterium]MBR7119843.1 hypothetical protein [Lentisphaeria bacterium]